MLRATIDSTPSSDASGVVRYDVRTSTNLPTYVAKKRREASGERDCEVDEAEARDDVDDDDDDASTATAVEFTTRRRYREFASLHESLTKPPVNARLPPMPMKRILSSSTATTSERVEQFQFLLDAVARDHVLRECEVVVDFLTGGNSTRMRRSEASMNPQPQVSSTATPSEPPRRSPSPDAWMDEGPVDLDADRDRGSLDRLMRSTMLVHRGKEDRNEEGKTINATPREASDDGDAFATEEMTTTTTTTTTTVRAMTSIGTTNDPSSTRTPFERGPPTCSNYESTVSGAREAIKANDADGLASVLSADSFDVNVKDSSGMTLLHLACLLNRKSAVEILIERGGDPEIVNAQGESAIECAPATLGFWIERETLKNRKK